jgi:isoleucyl-tRNA synthetase
MFNPVNSRVNFPQLEERILRWWKENDIFRRSIDSRRGGPLFLLFDGPPTVNGSPAIHHVYMSVFKDLLPRYKAMQGYCTPRIGGWDTHGLPVELEIEKQLGFSGKAQIEEYGIAKFNELCRQSVNHYIGEFEEILERCGYWVDLEHPYVTMDNNYIESVWWAIKQMWDKGLVYQGYKVTPHCPRCGTSLSSHEVAQGYQEDTEDPSVYIKFKVVDRAIEYLAQFGARRDLPTYLLAWTTTPWTLPGNTALAVNPDADYAIVEVEIEGRKEQIILAEALIKVVFIQDYHILGTCSGNELMGQRLHGKGVEYEPLFRLPQDLYLSWKFVFNPNENNSLGMGGLSKKSLGRGENFWLIAEDFVSLDEGTGIVHIAPAFGEVDYDAGSRNGLYFVQPVDQRGIMMGDARFEGKFVKDADAIIISDLKMRRLLLRSGTIKHTYPFCWRCEAPLLYYAKQTWYIRTTALKDELIAGNNEINWYPEHIKNGRFGDWLQNNVDWAFSRERYWGTPLPVWRCESCGEPDCVGGVADLTSKKGFNGFQEPLDLHRPYVDEMTYDCPACGGKMKRVPEVIDCWFDSGAMPVAQSHYPFENETLLEDGRFPADYICEAVDQTRGWFYSLHAISTLLFNRPCYRNVICLGHILDARGEKMSKRKGNVVLPKDVIPEYGADALRWYLYVGTSLGNPRQFDEKQVQEASRRFLSTLWNVYSFFVLYANIDKYQPDSEWASSLEAELDRWIISELNQLVSDVVLALDAYNPIDTARKIEGFVDGLSNWYVRRSRRRFWKSENDADKLSAYNTLYQCLVTLSKLLAPFTPFLAEELYQNLVRSAFPGAPESVHLADFPVADESRIDKQLSDDNRLAMKVSSMGRAARSKAGIKVRQPLEQIYVGVSSDWEKRALERIEPLVLEELNIKELYTDSLARVAGKEESGYVVVSETSNNVAVSTYITVELEAEGIAREIVHRVQTMRRTAGYDIADHIITYYEGDAAFVQDISAFADYIRQETLSRELEEGVPEDADFQETYKISGHSLLLGVKRAG